MELKPYQQKVIADLSSYLTYLHQDNDLARAFQNYWKEQGVSRMEAYKNNIPGVPHVCVKVPTAGGKTFIAANALRPIFESFAQFQPVMSKVVIWLVPSLTILEQTLNNLSNPQHAYRQRLNTHFNGRVVVFNKQDVLQGAGFNYDALQAQLNIIVLSFDSLRARNKEDRKIFQENSNLMSFARQTANEADRLPDYDETALINVLRTLRPVVVVDESHNAETELSVEMLRNLNPSFILDLTATPRRNSNIISYVDAMQLKKQCMVKLPVIVHNFRDKTDVLNEALQLQRKLEAEAEAEAAEGGASIRPIVLFQAQPRTGDEATTFEKIKQTLIKLHIPEEQIKIKTSEINELKGIDLMSRDCPVRYIITVNALKEGWDCPFAYVLASLADKSSAVDVEQILGRILRQPHTRQHQREALNLSYVFTASNKFLDTLNSVVAGLNRAGFSERDCRVADVVTQEPKPEGIVYVQPELFIKTVSNALTEALTQPETETTIEEFDDTRLVAIDSPPEQQQPAISLVETIVSKALEQSTAYEQQAQSTDESTFVPTELADKMNRFTIKDVFAEETGKIHLPQFYRLPAEANDSNLFSEAQEEEPLYHEELLKDFRLSRCDNNIDFAATDVDTYLVDLEEIGNDNVRPVFKKVDERRRQQLHKFILSLPPESQIQQIAERLCQLTGNLNPIPDKEIKLYVKRILEDLSAEQLHDCLANELVYKEKIKRKILDLATEHKEKQFLRLLDTDQVILKPAFSFPEIISPSDTAPAITKSLYTSEASMNQFEQRVINDIANLPSVMFWHRNLERHGFYLNGFLNHYPDFIVRTRSGKTLIIESKGDDRDNSDSRRKLKLGQLWAAKAGNEYRYLMVFDNLQVEGAYRLAEAVNVISQM